MSHRQRVGRSRAGGRGPGPCALAGAVALALGGLALLRPAPAGATPLDLSGNLGYSYRSLASPGTDAVSNQLLATLNFRSYLWQPWFATAEGTLTAMRDDSQVDNGAGAVNAASDVVTGNVVLNVLPWSRAPFQLVYQASDTRVDQPEVANPLVTLAGEDFRATLLDLRQSYRTTGGDRYQLRYSNRTWDSDRSGRYEDDLYGVEVDLKPHRQRLLARANKETTRQRQRGRQADNVVVDVEHYYFPSEELRFDSKASVYSLDSSFDQSTGILGTTTTDVAQVSSFVFWQPTGGRWSVSGGMRAFRMQADDGLGHSPDQNNLSLTAGAFYQYTKRLRLDGSFSLTTSDRSGAERSTNQRERLGALYQSDLLPVGRFTYQWYADGGVENQSGADLDLVSASLRLGHNAQRGWHLGGGSLTLSLNQAASENAQSKGSGPIHRLDHNATLGWSRMDRGGSTFVRLSLAEARRFGGQDDVQDLINLQLSRNANLSRRVLLTGDLTLQGVHRRFDDGSRSHDTTLTGQLNYSHTRFLGVPRLQLRSYLRLSQSTLSEGLDRNEWEGRLDYAIGLTQASLSFRRMQNGHRYSSLFYARVTRSF